MDLSPETDYGAHEQSDSDSSDSSMDNIIPNMTIVLTGNSLAVQFGHENILLGEEEMNTEDTDISRIVPVQRQISECHVSVINMTGLHEAELSLDSVNYLTDQLVNENEIHAFIFVVRLGQLTDSDKMGLEWLQRVFGDKVLQFVMILFTYEREEECDTIIDDLKKNPVLEQLLKKCGGRYHTCNQMMNKQSEMRDLMNKIERLFNENEQQCYTSEMDPNAKLNFILLGKKQVGKSASGNTILGRESFVSKKSSKSVTQHVAVESGNVCGLPVTVYDTPGLFEQDMREEEIQQLINEKVLQKCESGPCVFLLVIKPDSFTTEERKTVEKIEKVLGETCLDKTWILFTRGDELEEENMTIQEFINENEQLKKLVEKYDQRYHVFNNKERESSDQARSLLLKIIKRSQGVKDGRRLTGHIPDSRANPQDEPDTLVSSLSSMRIVLLGKTGFGKSASGNTILGEREFISEISSKSITHKCSVKHSTVSGRSVSLVDTPGFFDTKMKQMRLMKQIAKSVYLSSPGPHAFLILFKVNDRFTEHEQQIPQMIEMMFGEEVLKYAIILFTHGDQLEGKSVEEIIQENSRLRDLVQQCGGRYQVFNNKDLNNKEQVNDLLQNIDTMIKQNGGEYYSNQIYEDAHRFRQVEEERIQKAKQRQEMERIRKEKEKRQELEAITFELEIHKAERRRDKEERTLLEKQRQETEKVRKEKEKVKVSEAHERSNRKRQSKNPEFNQFYRKHRSRWYKVALALQIASGQVVGAVIGGALGFIAGPVGAVAGAVAGAVVGTAVDAVVGAAVAGPVGTVVGAVVGAAVAGPVGTVVGAVVGTAVDAALGTAVGAVVDAVYSKFRFKHE